MLLDALELLLQKQLCVLVVDRHAGAQDCLLPKDRLKPFPLCTYFSDKGMFLELGQAACFPNPKKSVSICISSALIAICFSPVATELLGLEVALSSAGR